jgi:hypothetical protein
VRTFLSSNPRGVPGGRSPPGRAVPFREILAIVLRPYPMIIRSFFSLGRGIESMRARHAASPIDRGHDARSSFLARSASAIRPTTPKPVDRSEAASVGPTEARDTISQGSLKSRSAR